MSKQTEALKLALEAAEVLEALFKQAEAMHEEVTGGVNVHCQITVADLSKGLYAAAAIREALAEQPAQQQEPVAWATQMGEYAHIHWGAKRPEYPIPYEVPLYTTPPQRKPLTSQERDAQRWRFLMENSYDSKSVTQFHVWEHSWEPHSKTGEPTEWKQRVRGIALIDFIDRAIEQAHGITGEQHG